MTVRCPAESLSLLYLNPPYDLEVGQQSNKRLELVFLEHAYRWLDANAAMLESVSSSSASTVKRAPPISKSERVSCFIAGKEESIAF